MNRPAIDLTRQHYRRVLGEFTVIGTWLGADLEDCEPCIVLMPTHRKPLVFNQEGALVRARPCCIALSAAHKYDEPSYLVLRAGQFLQAMGFDITASRAYRLAEIIHESLQDLCTMPELPPAAGSRVVADATLTDESGRKRTAEVVETY